MFPNPNLSTTGSLHMFMELGVELGGGVWISDLTRTLMLSYSTDSSYFIFIFNIYLLIYCFLGSHLLSDSIFRGHSWQCMGDCIVLVTKPTTSACKECTPGPSVFAISDPFFNFCLVWLFWAILHCTPGFASRVTPGGLQRTIWKAGDWSMLATALSTVLLLIPPLLFKEVGSSHGAPIK